MNLTDLDAAYRDHAASVYRFLLAKTGSGELAEELTQETFYQAVKSADRFDGSSQITTWLIGIARNVLANHIRKRKSIPVSDEVIDRTPGASAEEEVLANLGKEEILTAVHCIPEPGREVLYLRLLGTLSFREIGSVLGQNENWARVTYYRAKLQLLKELKSK